MWWWWLSFVDTDQPVPPPEEMEPGGGRFLGVCIVEGREIQEAVSRAWALGCNPGGQVLGFGPFDADEVRCPPDIRDRLLSRAELAEHDLIGSWDDYGLEANEKGYLHEKGCSDAEFGPDG